MKVLLVKPMEHPQVVDIEDTLEEYYRVLECDCITAAYPWEEPVALVTDDNGLFTEKPFSRYVKELEQPIKGNLLPLRSGRRGLRRAAGRPDPEIHEAVLGARSLRQYVRTTEHHPDG